MGGGDEGFIVFVDESGDHGLENIDPASPVFVLVFCIVRKTDYARTVGPAITEFKFRHFGHDQVILHERDIRTDSREFSILRDPAKKNSFLDELTELITGLPITLIATTIRKDLLRGQYVTPGNPYEIALRFGLERVAFFTSRRGHGNRRVPIIIEMRGRKEDNELELEFRRICSGPGGSERFPFDPHFVSKAANVPGLQVADLVARPIGRYVIDPAQPNRAWDTLSAKLDRSPEGKFDGWGLKVFP